MNEFVLEKFVARCQLFVSTLWLAGYFIAVLLASPLFNKALDPTYVRDMTPITMLIITFWFQRERSRSAADPHQIPSSPVTPVEGAPHA